MTRSNCSINLIFLLFSLGKGWWPGWSIKCDKWVSYLFWQKLFENKTKRRNILLRMFFACLFIFTTISLSPPHWRRSSGCFYPLPCLVFLSRMGEHELSIGTNELKWIVGVGRIFFFDFFKKNKWKNLIYV